MTSSSQDRPTPSVEQRIAECRVAIQHALNPTMRNAWIDALIAAVRAECAPVKCISVSTVPMTEQQREAIAWGLRVGRGEAESAPVDQQQEIEGLKAETTRRILRATLKGYQAGENDDSKAWRQRAEAAEAELATLKQLIADLNNELKGSHGFFLTSPSLVVDVVELKTLSNRRYSRIKELEAELATLRAPVDQDRQRDEKALGAQSATEGDSACPLVPASQLSHDEPFVVEVDKAGCERCGHGTQWTVVGPGEIAISQSFEDKELAEEIAEYMNQGFRAGCGGE